MGNPNPSTQNRFAKGKSGNPGGRPKSPICLTFLLRAALAERDPETKRILARRIVDALVGEALTGNVEALKQVWNRIDGPVPKEQPAAAFTLEEIAQEMKARSAAYDADQAARAEMVRQYGPERANEMARHAEQAARPPLRAGLVELPPSEPPDPPPPEPPPVTISELHQPHINWSNNP